MPHVVRLMMSEALTNDGCLLVDAKTSILSESKG